MTTPGQIIVLSWNLDGLELEKLEERTEGAIDIISNIKPDVVLLQEVVDTTQLMLLGHFSELYEMFSDSGGGYFNAILVKKDTNIKIIGELKITRFPGTNMERKYLLQNIKVFERSLTLITTHLESLKDYTLERQNQLKTCFSAMLTQDEDKNVIFAGDLNLREPELKGAGGLPSSVSDAWTVSGEQFKTKFTWDLKLNDNKQFEWGKPRARYDRMYYKCARKNPICCVEFQLVGKDRLPCKMFPSDHFGILATFKFS